MTEQDVLAKVETLSAAFAENRNKRQRRRHLDPADFAAIRATGYPMLAVPENEGGGWTSVAESVEPICRALRSLARGDSSVALVCAMHPAVLSYWLTVRPDEPDAAAWRPQLRSIFDSVIDGHWWGTITSEPGTGGDVLKSRTVAAPTDGDTGYRLSGQKHFGSGSGVVSNMVTTAIAKGEEQPDWFYVDMSNVVWGETPGLRLIAEWDGHGMAATQSHAVEFDGFPATRIAWPGHLPTITSRTGGFIGCLFASVIVGIVDVAMETAKAKIRKDAMRPYELIEWTRAKSDAWLIRQAFDGMIRAAATQVDSRVDVVYGKTAVAELAEDVLRRLCRILGGSTFSRHSPFGYWFEDVRALGFLRPPWGLAFEILAGK